METFAAELSHGLKNPVAAIRASAEVLSDGASEEPEQAEHFLARILESTARIEALLGDLLSLAKLEARGLEDAGAIDLGQCAEQAVATVRESGAEVSDPTRPLGRARPRPTIELRPAPTRADWLSSSIQTMRYCAPSTPVGGSDGSRDASSTSAQRSAGNRSPFSEHKTTCGKSTSVPCGLESWTPLVWTWV